MGFQGAAAVGRGPGAGARKPGLLQAFAALKYKDYRTLWTSQLFSFMGMQMQQVARGLLAYQLTGSYTAVGVTMMAWGIPQLGFSLIGGAVADRVNKRNVILISQAGTGLLSLFNAILITTGYISIPWLFVLGLAQGTLFAFNMPARQALVPELVPQGALLNAIALNNVGMNATRIVGPAAAGVMIGVWGVESAYYTQSVMLLFVVGLTLMLPPSTSHLQGAAQRKGIFHEIGLGLRFIASSRTLMLLMLMAFVPTLIGMPYISLLPGFAVSELGLDASVYGLMFTVTGIGAIVGSVAVAAMTDFSRKPLMQAVMGLGYGLSLAGLGLGAMFFGYTGSMLALLALGLFSTTYQTLNNTMVMAETRPEFYGRVMSVYMLTFSLFPLMSGPMGVVADEITATSTFIVLGGVITAFIALTIVLAPRYTLRRTSTEPAGPRGVPGGMPAGANAAAGAPTPVTTTPLAPGARLAPMALALAAGDADPLHAASSSDARSRARRPRRDYLSGPATPSSARPDYMGGAPASASSAPLPRTPAPPAASDRVAFPGTGTYGLVSRAVPAAPPPRRRSYGFEPRAALRAFGGSAPVEAGDAVGAFAPIALGDGVPAPRATEVGRFLRRPIERVVVPAVTLRAENASRPMLIAALTAALGTSLMALFVRHEGRRRP